MYADKADIFNKYTTQACEAADFAQATSILSRDVMTTIESNLQYDESDQENTIPKIGEDK